MEPYGTRKAVNVNLLLSATAVVTTAPLIIAQVSSHPISYSICLLLSSPLILIHEKCLFKHHNLITLLRPISLLSTTSNDRLLVPHRGPSTLSTRKAIVLLLLTISTLQTTSTSAIHGRGIIYAAKLDSNLGKTQLGPALLKMTQSRHGRWRGHWLGDAAVLQ